MTKKFCAWFSISECGLGTRMPDVCWRHGTRLFTFKTSWRQLWYWWTRESIRRFFPVNVIKEPRPSMKISFMTPKVLGKRRLAGAFGVEGSRARRNSEPRLVQLQGSFEEGVVRRRRYLLNCEHSRHSLCSVRTLTSLLDYFHHAKERRKFKMGNGKK